jgi:hypothetical protein
VQKNKNEINVQPNHTKPDIIAFTSSFTLRRARVLAHAAAAAADEANDNNYCPS